MEFNYTKLNGDLCVRSLRRNRLNGIDKPDLENEKYRFSRALS